MDATPGISGSPHRRQHPPAGGEAGAAASTIAFKWAALHDAGAAAATLAGLSAEPPGQCLRDFPRVLEAIGGWQCRLAEQGMDDLAAIMEPGLSALLSARDRGADPAPGARALWQEFTSARDALVRLFAPAG